MADLNELKPVGKLNPFAKFCCTIGNLPTSYMISLTYEEQLLWLCKYLEDTVIPAVNTNAEAVQELQELYVVLKNYVDNYFENLDVQEEINQKLDEMADDGTLAKVINQQIFDELQNTVDDHTVQLDNHSQDIGEIEDSINSIINDIQVQNSKISSLENISPIVVGSTSDMTDTSKIYLNTTDGYWYYYSSGSWTQGGLYQDSNNILELKNNLANKLYVGTKIIQNSAFNTSSGIQSYVGKDIYCIRVKSNSLIKKFTSSSGNIDYYGIFASEPSVGSVSIIDRVSVSALNVYNVSIPANGIWIGFQVNTGSVISNDPVNYFDGQLDIINELNESLNDNINNLMLNSTWENKIWTNPYPSTSNNVNFAMSNFIQLEVGKKYKMSFPHGFTTFSNFVEATTDTNPISEGWKTSSYTFIASRKYIRIAIAYVGYSTPISLENRIVLSEINDFNEENYGTIVEPYLTLNKFINKNNGQEQTITTGNYAVTNYIEIPNGASSILTNFKFNTDGIAGWALYDNAKYYIRGGQTPDIPLTGNESYIKLTTSNYSSVDATHNANIAGRRICFVSPKSKFKDKVLAFSGDSITFGYNDDDSGKQLDVPWVYQVGCKLGCKENYNLGISSASLMNVSDPNKSIYELYDNYSNDIDYIGFMIGINDCYRRSNGESGYVFGTINDNTDETFLGCLNLLCQGAIAKWKPEDNKHIFFITYYISDQPGVGNSDVTYNGYTGWKAWMEATKDVCKKYSIPVCDTYEELGITQPLDTDGTYWKLISGNHSAHLTQKGSNVFASCVANWMNRMFGITD